MVGRAALGPPYKLQTTNCGRGEEIIHLNETRDDMTVHLERAVLVSVALPNRPWQGDDPLDELRGLAETAGARIVGELTQKRVEIVPGTYIGKGKLTELTELCQAKDAEVVIFDNDLS